MAGSTTVRIDAVTKRRLERLAERLSKTQGRRVTQQEILERGLEFLDARFDEFVAPPAAQRDPWADLDAAADDHGALSTDVDDVLYGARP